MDPDLTNTEWEQEEGDPPSCEVCLEFVHDGEEINGKWYHPECDAPVCGHCDGAHASRDCPAVTRMQESEFVPPKTMQEADELLEELR